jgi:acyl carrier protein
MKNKDAIIEILGLEDDQVSNLEASNKMQDYNFDSLAIVMLQSFIDEEYNIQIDPDNLPSFEMINDLDLYIESHKS